MKKIKLILTITALAFFCVACGDNCSKTTYRPEVGVGFVFRYDTINNTSYPVAGAKITVESKYWEPGMYGADLTVAEETFTTNAEGRYQVRFVERGCWTNSAGRSQMVYCNAYDIYCNNKYIIGYLGIHNAQNNIKKIDTIKLK